MPPSKVHQATVVEHTTAGRGYYRLVLKTPGLAVQAKPGQFVMLRVSENRDPLLARPFGIASVKAKHSIELYYRVVGRGTSLLTEVSRGSILGVVGPLGKGFPVPDQDMTPLLVCGGSGFPPLFYFAASLRRRAQLFLGARNKESLPPSPVITSIRKQVKKVHVATDDGSGGRKGFVTDLVTSFLDTHKAPSRCVIYACGPRAMMAAVAKLAAERGILCFVSLEERMACGLGVCMGCSVPIAAGGYKRVCKEGPVFDAREIEWSNKA